MLLQSLVLMGGTVWMSPAAEPVRNATVVVTDGRIASVGRGRVSVPAGARVIDCKGLTVLAGFWNSHVHFFQRKWENAATLDAQELARQVEAMTTRYGFTSVFDIASDGNNTRAIRDRIGRGELPGPNIRTTGEAIVAPGAVPAPNILRILGNMVTSSHEVTNASQAALAAQAILNAGGDGIKIHLQRPIPEDAVRAAVEVAHRAGKWVFVHPSTRADVLMAARAGADVLAHNTPFSEWDAATVPALLDKRVAITPTLALWRFALRHDRVSVQGKALDEALRQLRAWVAAGGSVLFGNDLGAVEYDPAEEYELMERAGMSFRQILASLTTAPSERFGDAARRGQIAVGLAGDLAVVEGDPSRDIGKLAAVRYTIREGRVVFDARRRGPLQ